MSFKPFAVLFTAALLSACTATKVSQIVTMPANESGMAKAKNIAVVGVGGNRTSYPVAERLEAYLTSIKVKGVPHFNVVDRLSIDKVKNEQRLSSSELFDASTAAKLGRLVGADTIITGKFSIPKISREKYQETEQYCIQRKKVKSDNPLKALFAECLKYGQRQVYCSKKVAKVDFSPKATDVTTSRVVYAKTYSGRSESHHCSNENTPHRADSDMIADGFEQIFDQMRRDVAPYTQRVEVALMEKDDSQMPDAVENVLSSALKFAEKNRFTRACELMAQGLSMHSGSPALLYNNGVCAEIRGDLEKALAFYQQADRNSMEPYELIGDALARMERRAASDRKLASQLAGREEQE